MHEEGRQLVDLLALAPMPEVAAALRARRNEIVTRWQRAVETLLPDADPLTAKQVRDSIPIVLDHLARALASDKPAETQLFFEVTQAHGVVRFQHQFNVRELIIEYRLLRRAIVDEIREKLGDGLGVVHVQAVDIGVDIAMQQAVVAFTEKQNAMLDAAGESQSRYLAFLSHDLRNNLNGVTLTLEVLALRLRHAAGFADELKEIEGLQRSVAETIKGMDRLLQAERLRNKQAHLDLAPVDLVKVVQDVVAQARRAAAERGLRLEAHTPTEAVIKSDRDLVAVVLQNLIGNAIKYSERGVVRVAVAPRPAGAPGWVLSVSDEGPGISSEYIGKIFSEFARGETYGQAGVGLGLTIAARAARAIGATLSVESKVGVGSTFELVVPG
jgi:signal transduction histidine kinase